MQLESIFYPCHSYQTPDLQFAMRGFWATEAKCLHRLSCTASWRVNWTSHVNSVQCPFKTPLLVNLPDPPPHRASGQQHETSPPPRGFDYLALYDLGSQPLGMAIAQVAGGDSHLLPEQAELKLDLNRPPRETGGTGGSHCGHGESSCGKNGIRINSASEKYKRGSLRVFDLITNKNRQKKTSTKVDILKKNKAH